MTNRGKASYFSSCTRHDLNYSVNRLSENMVSEAIETDFKRLETVFKRLREELIQLLYGNFDLDTAELHVFDNAIFETNIHLSSQLGHIFLIVDQDKKYSIIKWSSTKCK